MQLSLTFKNMDASDAIKSKLQEKFDRLDKILDNPAQAHVVFSVEKLRHIVEVNFRSDKFQIHAKEESENMYASIDAVADKIKLQLQKNKDKLKRHLAGDKESIKNSGIEISDQDMLEDNPITR